MIAAYGVPFLNGMKYYFEMIACGGIFFSMIQKCCFEMTQLAMAKVTSEIRANQSLNEMVK